MQSHVKIRAIRVLGGVVVALAVVPWLGVGAASASGGTCSTRPPGVSADATCTPLFGPNGTKVLGETWAVRTSNNHIVVDTFPSLPLSGPGSVILCVRTSGAYPAKHQCTPLDPDNVFTGNSTTIDIALSAHGISAADAVWYGLTVMQGSSAAVSNGGVGAVPTSSPTPTITPSKTPTKTPSVTPSHTTTHSPTHNPSASVLPTKIGASPSTSVLGTKLAHTGSSGVAGALVVSVGLLGFGGILLAAAQTVPASARRRH